MGWLIAKYGTMFMWSTWKFLFAPVWGWNTGLTFIEIFIAHTLGGWLAYLVFFYGASFFVNRRRQRIERKKIRMMKQGKTYEPRKFTFINRLSVRVKRLKYGYVVMLFLAASFASVQVGALIMSFFYADRKRVWLHSLIVFVVSSLILTTFWKFSKVL